MPVQPIFFILLIPSTTQQLLKYLKIKLALVKRLREQGLQRRYIVSHDIGALGFRVVQRQLFEFRHWSSCFQVFSLIGKAHHKL